jgi:hypothetical protein
MARAKKAGLPNDFWEDLLRTADEFDKQNPLVSTKYIVVEGFWRGNEYDYNTDWFESKRFEFDSEDERTEWLDDHEPDKYREFRLARREIRQFNPKPYLGSMPMTWERGAE